MLELNITKLSEAALDQSELTDSGMADAVAVLARAGLSTQDLAISVESADKFLAEALGTPKDNEAKWEKVTSLEEGLAKDVVLVMVYRKHCRERKALN